ncbi:DUF4192 domain-containing protein [Actinorugispora endophytica]|uniref:Uncharacterized protein DUF4192 n=1 Tax=Actinorugispora endophytica TaxID=1605990 RepID=A0A4R6UNP1_9ACTN|nr:DUF4192 domain-containing protein [Actinorugispora endophytica]TDQ48768.1 uncharacterized protein DUF4192 [Actinorugispora endophytica]
MTTEETPDTSFQLTVRSPVDLIAAVPYLVGFQPERGLVVLGVDAATGAVDFAVGYEPVAGDDPADPSGLAERLCDSFDRERRWQALAVGYGSEEWTAPRVAALRTRLDRLDVAVVEALRLAGGRYWSYVCRDPGCCPAEGTPYDVHRSAVPATAVTAGLRPWSRAELLAFTGPVNGPEREEMRRATLAAETRRTRLWGRPAPDGRAPSGASFTAAGIRAVRAAVAAAVRGGPPPDPETVAWLGVLLVGLRARDEAWSRIDRAHIAEHIGLWSHVLRRVDPAYAAAPACLLAFAAWQNEDPYLAEAALDRAVEAVPDYSMALLIRQALRHGVSPRNWRGFTPEWLAERSPVPEAGNG